MIRISTGGTAAGLLSALQEVAADYFDTIEIDSGNSNIVNCYVGETCFLKIGITANLGLTITTSAGATTTITGVNYPINEIYSCESGILLVYKDPTYQAYYGFITIGLDANGKVCVASPNTYSGSIEYTTSNNQRIIWSASVDDTAISYYYVQSNKQDEITGKTGLSPIYTQGSYMQGIWVPMLFQFRVAPPNPILIMSNGAQYLQSVMFILEDGQYSDE